MFFIFFLASKSQHSLKLVSEAKFCVFITLIYLIKSGSGGV